MMGIRPRQRRAQLLNDEATPVAGDAAPSKPFKRARELRTTQTLSEYKLWLRLRGKQILDLRFRRQHPIGPYFADFVCLPLRLVVEVDGPSHLTAAQIDHDIARTRWLKREGYKVIRFWNLDVLTNIDWVLERILSEANERAKTVPRKYETKQHASPSAPAEGRSEATGRT